MSWVARLGGESAIIEGILEEFWGLCAVPHGSWNEAAESAYLMDRLARMGLRPVRDEIHNIMADVPAAPGHEAAPVTILQGHMDMVCAAAPGSGWDAARDAVTPVAADGLLRSDGRSSLGADNNLGNAAVLWLLGRGLPHGPLRLLFTVAEEVGLQGARRLDPAWLAGAKYLINTDGFHLGRAVVGSAGGLRETFTRPLITAPAELDAAYTVSLDRFTGGHSGDDIHRGRANPLRLLASFLAGLDFPWELAELSGGQGHNVIPAEGRATVVVRQADGAALRAAVEAFRRDIACLHRETDPAGRVTLERAPRPETVWKRESRDAALDLLLLLFSGVCAPHPGVPGVTGASANLGRVGLDGAGNIEVCAFIRCAHPFYAHTLDQMHRRAGERLGFQRVTNGYPAWTGDLANPLAARMAEVWRAETGGALEMTAVHVGLEPSFFQEKAPGLIMVSTGPEIIDAHSVDERAPLSALPPYAALLAGTLAAIGAEHA